MNNQAAIVSYIVQGDVIFLCEALRLHLVITPLSVLVRNADLVKFWTASLTAPAPYLPNMADSLIH